MPLHPSAREFLEQRAAAGARPVEELSVEQAREQGTRLAKLLGPGEPVAKVADREIPGPYGAIPIRVYVPTVGKPQPILVYYHGGGWVTGNLETVDVTCRALANAAPCVVVSVNYRHAPEQKFPAAAEDAYASARWVAAHAGELGGDAQRIAVGGASAGGNLAAVVALMARERSGPALAFQLLTVPVTSYAMDTASYAENAEGYGLTRVGMEWYWRAYVHGPEEGAQPYASPLRAPDLHGLPAAYVQTAELDPLRDEGEAYAARLREAGVRASLKRYNGMVHGYLGPDGIHDAARALREALS